MAITPVFKSQDDYTNLYDLSEAATFVGKADKVSGVLKITGTWYYNHYSARYDKFNNREYKRIIRAFGKAVAKYLLQGREITLPYNLGYFFIKRVNIDATKRLVNVNKTLALRKSTGNLDAVVYRDNDHYFAPKWEYKPRAAYKLDGIASALSSTRVLKFHKMIFEFAGKFLVQIPDHHEELEFNTIDL